jgi:hypothetical protein
MIEAGAEIAWRTPIMDPDDEMIRRMVAEVFQAMGRPTAVQYLYMDGRLRFEHITPVRAVKTITTTAAREERSKIGIPWVF